MKKVLFALALCLALLCGCSRSYLVLHFALPPGDGSSSSFPTSSCVRRKTPFESRLQRALQRQRSYWYRQAVTVSRSARCPSPRSSR